MTLRLTCALSLLCAQSCAAPVPAGRTERRRSNLGPAGAGQTVKLVNQILCAGNFLIVAEAVKFAESQGIDASRIPAALVGGRADSAILQEFMGKMARRDFSPTGRIDEYLSVAKVAGANATLRKPFAAQALLDSVSAL